MNVVHPSKRVLRRIDRLSRAAHRFHRFAHHPLCDRYAEEVVRVGKRVRLCRGCTLAAVGGVAGASIGLASAPTPTLCVVAGCTGAALLAISLFRRSSKWQTRFVPALALALAATGGVALAACAVAIGLGLVVAYRRRGPDRSPCTTCPEAALSPCSGFAPIVLRERAFQRATRRLLVVS